MASHARWTKWGGSSSCEPVAIEHPQSEEQIVDIVRSARAAGERVKVAGSGHSFTDVACTDGRLLLLDRYRDLLGVDAAAGTATVQAGITILELNEALAPFKLALENMGDVGYQTISGAISTATHGTGERFRNISSQVVALRIVTASGEVITCSEKEDAETFKAAQVGLGALGAISTVTLRVVPAFNIRSAQEPRRLDDLLEEFDDLTANNDHFEFLWFPHTEWAQSITNTRTSEPLTGKGRSGAGAYVNDILLENHAFGLVQRAGRLNPAWIPGLAKFTTRLLSKRVIFDRGDRVLANVRLVRFKEMEYALPRAQVVPALRELRTMIERRGLLISFPVEVRVVAADDIPLSTAYGRPTGYIAVHVFHRFQHEPYFREVEAIMKSYGGRPHWGKLHFQDAESLRPLYPGWDRFLAVRDRLDPEGVFANAYLDRVLGKPRELAAAGAPSVTRRRRKEGKQRNG
jgi:L-gulonolactone oxidase